jgi:serine protease SohB
MDWLRDLIAKWRMGPPVVAVVPLSGVIGGQSPYRRSLTLASIGDSLDRAFKVPNLKAVALAVNSPGGTPAQASLIHRRIRALAAEKAVPVIAFAEDAAASGGYWLALAADEIFADENSVIGSIGVIYAGFGLEGLIEKLGVERRVHTSGEKKQMLDPFQPEKAEDVARLKTLQADIHANFREIVRARRGQKLKVGEAELFSGEFWTGRRALALGLVDGIGELQAVMRQRFGAQVRFRTMRGERSLLRTLLRPESRHTEARWAEALIGAVEERLAWSRIGL